AWKLLMPILEVWKNTAPSDFPNYAVGSWGPEDVQGLLDQQGHRWPVPTELKRYAQKGGGKTPLKKFK
ncbi:MAG: hypothetical protein EHM64_13160, partial [Ignavibacteriae bacterium]